MSDKVFKVKQKTRSGVKAIPLLCLLLLVVGGAVAGGWWLRKDVLNEYLDTPEMLRARGEAPPPVETKPLSSTLTRELNR